MNDLFSARTLELTSSDDSKLDTVLFHALSHLFECYETARKLSDFPMVNNYARDLADTISLVKRFYPYRISQFRAIFSQEYLDFPFDTFFGKGGEADEK